MSQTLEQRIDRLESLDAIRQLPAKYALTLDMRDIDAMVTLFAEDVRVGRDKSGRLALREYMDATLRSPFTGTSHHIGGHIIEFDDPDHAHGIVYSKNEHETPVADGQDEWVIMQMMYVDDYVRQNGRWYFAFRKRVVDWTYEAPSAPASTAAGLTRGENGPGDVSYQSLPNLAAFLSNGRKSG